MNGISNYQAYQNSSSYAAGAGNAERYASEKYRNAKYAAAKSERGVGQTKGTQEKSGVAETKKESVVLSDDAKALLEKLKKDYRNMDFTVADYSSTEEAQRYLSGGTKEYSVLIEPQLLEQMAADEKKEAACTEMLENAAAQLSGMKEKLGEESDTVRLGVSFGADGSTTYYAELEKSTERQKERIERARTEKKEKAKKEAEKAEEKKAEEKLKEKKSEAAGQMQKTDERSSAYGTSKRIRLYADSADELLEKIHAVDWNKVQMQNPVGGTIDFGV